MQTIEELLTEGKSAKDVVKFIKENSFTQNPKWKL